MFVRLSKVIQYLQGFIYKPTAFICKMAVIDGNTVLLKGRFYQKRNEVIDLQHRMLSIHNIRYIVPSVDGKYNEFLTVEKIKKN